MSSSSLVEFYDEIEPYRVEMVPVGDGHELYYEESGNEDGIPVLVVHGGPGGGSQPVYRRYFDASKYRICMFDQRGAGKSTPWASLENNTTWHSVADMEVIRADYMKVDRMLLFGGSWGSTLCLAYAETHSERVLGLILRGIFTLRRHELAFFYQQGSSFFFPEEFERYESAIPAVERHDLMSAYHRRLTGADEHEKIKAANAWTRWEMATSKLHVDPAYLERAEDPRFAVAFARIECHYFVHGGFFENDDQLIANAAKTLANVPIVIVQGRYDAVCPTKTAYDLYKQVPHAKFTVIADAGHSCTEPGIRSALIQSCNEFEIK
jgi:proline iminopeptidase